MELMKLMEERYSIRSFSNQPIEEDKIQAILNAGRLAPTARNNQPQRIIVMKDQESLQLWQKCTPCHFNEQLVMLICYDKNESWKRSFDGKDSGDVDASIVTCHMMLQATALGIGSTWVMHFDPEVACVEFNLPEQIIPVSALVMGYPSPEAKPSPRHALRKDLKETLVDYRK